MSLFAMFQFLTDEQKVDFGAKLTLWLFLLFFSPILIQAFRLHKSLQLGLSKSSQNSAIDYGILRRNKRVRY